jgi:hypothetical protein
MGVHAEAVSRMTPDYMETRANLQREDRGAEYPVVQMPGMSLSFIRGKNILAHGECIPGVRA